MRVLVSYLTRKRSGDVARREVEAVDDVIGIGRGADCHIYLHDPRVSLRHAEINQRAGGIYLEDAKTPTDTIVNGAVSALAKLSRGDKVEIGPYELIVVDPPGGIDLAITVELVHPRGDELEQLKSRSRVNLSDIGIGPRSLAWGLGLVVFALFLAWPIAMFFATPDPGTAGEVPRVVDKKVDRVWPLAGDIAWNSGDLSVPHKFIADNCRVCHRNAFERVADQACLSCHADVGNHADPAKLTGAELAQPSCQSCHIEHEGAVADIADVDDVACASCHEPKFVSFTRKHPPFSENFPYSVRTAIRFDHASHLEKHFADARYAERAPTRCAACHNESPNQRSLVAAGFEGACAACHADQIAQRELVLLRLPEFEENLIDTEAVVEACGPTLEVFEALIERVEALEAGEEPETDEEDGEEFEAVSTEEISLISAFLLDVASDDPDDYTEPMQELILALTNGDVEPLVGAIEERVGEPNSARLLAGLNPEVIKRTACAWAANLEYELPAEATTGGWFGDFLELRYRPRGHADDVAKAWIEYGIAAAADADPDDDSGARAFDLRDSLIDPKEGIGACAKCHAVSAFDAENENALTVQWRVRDVLVSGGPLKFGHGIHIRTVDARETELSEPERGCRWCHKLDIEADFKSGYADFDPHSFASNFKAIEKQTCVTCHAEGNMREDCQLCHDYHREPSFSMRMSNNEP